MDLKKKEKLDTVTVFDLKGNCFYIPDYQRGYRWTELEVKKLLLDLEEFFDETLGGSSFYCLQPLVVFFNEGKKAWEVIDGQQRLTTLYLILNYQKNFSRQKYPEIEIFELSYQSRPGSQEYLQSIDEKRKDENIDFHYMYKASKVIEEFLKNTSRGAERFVDAILNKNNNKNKPSIKFIWYDVTEEIKAKGLSPEDKFSDLNIGKISLTNAELIKALFLNKIENDESEALRIATEWDHIEHALQEEPFWAFIYGKEDGRYVTRIDFLFDIIKGKEEKEQNEYFTFDKYVDDFKGSSNKKELCGKLWKEITDKYYLFNGWYENKKLYHIIGYLRYQKQNIREIEECFYKQDISDVDAFYNELKNKALKDFSDIDFRSLNYNDEKDHKKIKDILILFNILSIIECEKENIRFSFHEFYAQAWDIEHIRSKTPKNLSGADREDWIICNLEYFSGVNYNESEIGADGKRHYTYREDFDLYRKDISDAPIRTFEMVPGYTVGRLCDELIALFNSKSDITESSVYKVLTEQIFKQDSAFKYVDNIGNLVLLDQGTNRGYKNSLYPVKRKWIYRRELEGIYILPCTRNVFSKNYSKMIFDLMNWKNSDAEAYMDEIERVFSDGKSQL